MYYTEIVLNPAHRRTTAILQDVYNQHRFIMSGFKKYSAEALGRVLYRIEMTDDGRLSIIIQSFVSPTYETDLARIRAILSINTKEVLFSGRSEPVLSNGMAYRFRLRANTVITRDGKRIGLIHEKALRDWFERRAAAMGVSLHGYDVMDEGYIRGSKDGKEIMLKIARFDGLLVIKDGSKFTDKFIDGFGHAKGFGCGLISLARV